MIMTNPINLQFPLRRGPRGGFATNSDTLSAVADDIRVLLLTNYGERPANYYFGCNLRSLIFEFEGDDLTQAIKDRIQSALEKWLSFVRIVKLEVSTNSINPDVQPNQIQVNLEFGIGTIDVTKTLSQNISV